MKDGLVYAFLFDGEGGARELGWEEIRQWKAEQGVLWMHMDLSAPETENWLANESGLDELSFEALISEATRPRTKIMKDGILVDLRGVNLNPGADPEDMVAMRMRVDENRIITTRRRKVMSVINIADALRDGSGPKTIGEFISHITSRLILNMEKTVEEIDDRLATLEDEVVLSEDSTLRGDLANVRREAIMLRRFMAPQREAMARLYSEKIHWLTEMDKLVVHESTDCLIRYIEGLDSVRERAAVTQEELASRLSEQMNKRMYILSLIAAIFLPLGFLTGLLGINVGGIPGAENNSAFIVFIFFLIVVGFFQLLIFKRKKWL